MQLLEPPQHPPVDEVAQVVQGVAAHGMSEVVHPSSKDLVDPDQDGPGVGLGHAMCQGTDLGLHRFEGPVGDEGIDVPLVRSSLAAPLDVEPQEVEPLAHVHYPCLGRRQAQAKRGEYLGDVFAQVFDVGALAVHEDDVGSARGAVRGFRPARFLGPSSEPGVPISEHRALHKSRGMQCSQAALAQGEGIAAPR